MGLGVEYRSELSVQVEHSALDGSERESRALRDLRLGEPFVMSPDEQFTVPSRKQSELRADGAGREVEVGELHVVCFGVSFVDLLVAVLLLPANGIDCATVNKCEEPARRCAACCIEARSRPPDVEEGLLHRIFRESRVSEDSKRDPVSLAGVQTVELVERPNVTLGNVAKQLPIAGGAALNGSHTLERRQPSRCYRDQSPGHGKRISVDGGTSLPIRKTDPRASHVLSSPDVELVDRLRAGDQAAFVETVRSFGPTMLRIARLYVRSDEVAEEVVQEAWTSVLEGLGRFEGRSAFRTWVLTILVHSALRRGRREARSSPFSAVARESGTTSDDENPDLDRFFAVDHPRWPSTWATVVPRLDELPEEKLLSGEAMGVVEAAISELPATQAAVLILHDVEGRPPEEICETLELNDGNRRILLHRARNRVRAALEHYFDDRLETDA